MMWDAHGEGSMCTKKVSKFPILWFILSIFSEWGQFGIMKVECIIPVFRILTFNIGFSEYFFFEKSNHKFG